MTSYALPEIFQFCSGDGPHLVISGAVHGNERCGPAAINRALDCIRQGRIGIVKGTVTFIPVANPKAYEQGVRFVERNLNRFMYPKDEPQYYEDHLQNGLCPIFRQADALLDLHSFTAPGEAFILLGPPLQQAADYARALGVRNFVHGWADCYAANSDIADLRESHGTTEYTRLHGGMAVTLECGSHKDPEAVEVGFQAILNALKYFSLADIDPALFDPRPVSKGPERCVRLTDVIYKREEGGFAKPWQNMTPVRKGELVATFNGGARLDAPADGYIIMPVEHEEIGAEWYYHAVESDYFARLVP